MRPMVIVRPSVLFTRARSRVSAHVIGIGGWNRPSGSSGTPSACPLMPT